MPRTNHLVEVFGPLYDKGLCKRLPVELWHIIIGFLPCWRERCSLCYRAIKPWERLVRCKSRRRGCQHAVGPGCLRQMEIAVGVTVTSFFSKCFCTGCWDAEYKQIILQWMMIRLHNRNRLAESVFFSVGYHQVYRVTCRETYGEESVLYWDSYTQKNVPTNSKGQPIINIA